MSYFMGLVQLLGYSRYPQGFVKTQETIVLIGDLLCSTQLCLVEAFQEPVSLFVACVLWQASLGERKSKDLNRASYLRGKAAIQDRHLG